jgi:manganese/iron transport system permease protein
VWSILSDPFEVAYLRRALFEVVLLGVLGGVVGTYVVLHRKAFLTEVVQHTVFPGIAVAFGAGFSLLTGALVSGLASVALLSLARRRRRVDADALMALVVAVFFAAGVVVVSRRTGFQSDLTQLLFGRILTVNHQQLVDTVIITVVCVAVLALLHKELVLTAFDPDGAAALGYHVGLLDLVLNVVVTLAVVAAVRAVGTVLVVAFLVTPAATARLVTRRVGAMMALAVVLGAGCGWLGLVVSYEGSVRHGWRLASGATVVATLTAAFVVVAAWAALRRRAGSRPAPPTEPVLTPVREPAP